MSLEDIELICSSLDTRSGQKRKRVEPKRILALASNGLKPSVETVSVKRGGAAYQVPIPIHERRQISLSVRWLLQSSMERMKKEKWHRFSDARIIESLFVLRDLSLLERKEQSSNAANDPSDIDLKSFSMAKKISMHRMAKSNRVFAHRRWR
jgi:small subunit ribosomal protein S7